MSEPAYSPVDSWRPIDLAQLELAPTPQPTLAGGLLYPARMHLWSGEPESGKSWAALVACALQLAKDRHVLYVDFETDEHQMLERLTSLGITLGQISRFLYVKPTDPVGSKGVHDHLATMLHDYQPDVVVVDAYAGALDLHDLDPNKGADVEKLNRALFRPLASTGAALLILDHLAKDKERRGRFSIGSERKVGAIDVHLGFDAVVPFGRGRKGVIQITVHKDRPGWLHRPRLCDILLESDPDTGVVAWTIREAQHTSGEQGFRPTILMEKVSRYVEEHGPAVSRNTIETDVTGQRKALRLAIDTLAREGFLYEKTGPRKSRLYTSHKPYRADQDDFAPTSPPPRPGEDGRLRPEPSPPIGGRGEVVPPSAASPRLNGQGEVNQTTLSSGNTDDDIPW